MPNKNYIVASRLSLSPSGIIVFDIQTRNCVKYFHESINNFWFSYDGNYLFSEWNHIYRTSSFFTSDYDVSPIGKFLPEPQYNFFWIDHHAASHSVWIIVSSYGYYYDEQREIRQYEDNDYTRKAIYYYDDVYNGRSVKAHYVFANSEGTELVVIRNTTNGNAMWSLEFVSIVK